MTRMIRARQRALTSAAVSGIGARDAPSWCAGEHPADDDDDREPGSLKGTIGSRSRYDKYSVIAHPKYNINPNPNTAYSGLIKVLNHSISPIRVRVPIRRSV